MKAEDFIKAGYSSIDVKNTKIIDPDVLLCKKIKTYKGTGMYKLMVRYNIQSDKYIAMGQYMVGGKNVVVEVNCSDFEKLSDLEYFLSSAFYGLKADYI